MHGTPKRHRPPLSQKWLKSEFLSIYIGFTVQKCRNDHISTKRQRFLEIFDAGGSYSWVWHTPSLCIRLLYSIQPNLTHADAPKEHLRHLAVIWCSNQMQQLKRHHRAHMTLLMAFQDAFDPKIVLGNLPGGFIVFTSNKNRKCHFPTKSNPLLLIVVIRGKYIRWEALQVLI